LFYDTKSNKTPAPPPSATEGPPSAHFLAPESGEYEAGLTVIGDFDTVESFCRYFNWLKPPSKLEKNSNYHLFKKGIKPMWEDEANANGGKWVLTMKNNPQLLDRCWNWLAMALVGEDLDEGEEICGAVVSLRSKVDRIQLWTRSKDDIEKINGIGKKMVKVLDVSEADSIGLEFQVRICSCSLSGGSLTPTVCSTTATIVRHSTNSSPSKQFLHQPIAPPSPTPKHTPRAA
jgi:translation initiation factor 4E